MKFNYDVIVVGAGHAGCEAACASANMGAKTCLITIDMNKIAQMSCNPAIGGIAKGQIVREIDALGGYMGYVTDKSSLQFRMLNKSKGPAMWSPRAQCDRVAFINNWRNVLDNTPNLSIWQDQVKEIIVEHNTIIGVRTWWDVEFYAKSVIITAGTFLNGLMHIGKNTLPGGRCAEPAETSLTASINSYGINSARMKTGTPVRINRKSVHFEDMEVQPCETSDYRFSYFYERTTLPEIPCWTTHTNKKCHDILKSGLKYSPLYNGQIKSIGPRYCPSIETKLHTFADKDSHPLFLEPESLSNEEMYLNGFSSSLPIDIQLEALRAIPAFREVELYRPGYAIEYDFFDPTQLHHTLESKIISGLYFAGQVNGTTGYEEAGAQGIMAGINAALHCTSNKEFILNRDEAYIGVLIDDLVLKGVDEPYRMFTSRAEYRILLRQDNADIRLTEKSHNIGLASDERYQYYLHKKEMIDKTTEILSNIHIKPNDINNILIEKNITPINEGCALINCLSKPDMTFAIMENILKYIYENNITENCDIIKKFWDWYWGESVTLYTEFTEFIENNIKYQGYIVKQQEAANKMHKMESLIIKNKFNYNTINALSIEARQKLSKHQPNTIGEASRIPGISPNDINVLIVLMQK